MKLNAKVNPRDLFVAPALIPDGFSYVSTYHECIEALRITDPEDFPESFAQIETTQCEPACNPEIRDAQMYLRSVLGIYVPGVDSSNFVELAKAARGHSARITDFLWKLTPQFILYRYIGAAPQIPRSPNLSTDFPSAFSSITGLRRLRDHPYFLRISRP